MIGDYISIDLGAEPKLPGPEDFVGLPINRVLIASAKDAIAACERAAETYGEYRVLFFPESGPMKSGTTKQYYGRSLEAMVRARQIRQLFAGNGYILT